MSPESERTLAVIKPCATKNLHAGAILEIIEATPGFKVVAAKLTHYSVVQATEFYAEHCGRPYYDGLIKHTLSGPCWAVIIEGTDVVRRWRQLIGPTDPNKNDLGPGRFRSDLRAKFGTGVPDNALHGSDSRTAAQREMAILFPEVEQPSIGYIDV